MKKNRKISMSLIIAIIVGFTLAFSIIIFYSVLRYPIKNLYLEDVNTNNHEIADSAILYFGSKINEQISIIKGVEVAHHNIDTEGAIYDKDYYETIISHNPYIKSIEIIDKAGVIQYSSLSSENREGINLSLNPLISQIEEEHQLYIGSLVFNSSLNELSLEVVFSGENIDVFGLISIEYFQAYGEEFKVSFSDKEIIILDENGIFLYDSVNEYHFIRGRFDDFDKISNLSDSEDLQINTINGVEAVVSVRELNITPGYIVIYENVDSALSLSNTSQLYLSGVFAFVLIVMAITFIIADFFILREVKLVTASFVKIGEGKLEETIKDSSIKEFSLLRFGFNNAAIKVKNLTDRLIYLAYHDSLTGLATRNKANEDFDTLKSNEKVAFIYIDVERFAVINENYSFAVGDKTLRVIGENMLMIFDFVYRVEGDEYLILMPYRDVNEVQDKIVQLTNVMAKGIVIDNLLINISLKIGISKYSEQGLHFNELLQHAIIAVQGHRKNREFNYAYYDARGSDKYLRNSRIELLLSNAITDKEFYTIYQPIINAKDQSIRGFEALTRWNSKELGNVAPDEFIPILERTKRIFQLDRKVLSDAIRLGKFIASEHGVELVTSVNISVETLMRKDFVSMVDDTLEKYNYNPNLLELEITESTIVKDFDKVTVKMDYLRQKGVKFSEDDFGDAYSSLTYLTRLSIDTLKISKNFLSSILDNVESRVLVQTILELSKRLGFYTVVEGIEDEKTFELFKKYGCDYVQGYLFYRPMTDENILNLVKEKNQKGSDL